MAKDKTEAVTAPVPQEPTYEVDEIAKNAPRLFGYSIDIATAAFDINNVKRCTLEEAKRLIKEFAERKVK